MAETALRFTEACRLHNLQRPTWHFEYDAAPGVTAATPLPKRFWLRHEAAGDSGRTLLCWPDALCRLVLSRDGRTWDLAIAWEYDRATESHAQIRRKLDGYLPWLATRAYCQIVPQAADTRVFFVVPTRQRLHALVESLREHAAAGVVRLAIASQLDPASILTQPLWHPLDGGTARPILAGEPGCS